MSKKVLVVAGGGTGGHVLAGVAVADAWKKRFGAEAEIHFVGAQGGLEEKLVPRAGYPLTLLRVGSLNRVSWKKRLRTMLQLPFALFRSLIWLRSVRPVSVLGVGGYASGPLVLMARLFTSASTAILEQNTVSGFTNRLLGRWVHHVLCAFPGTKGPFRPERLLVTGNPTRAQITQLAPAQVEPFTLFAFGGSQGAAGINTLVLEALEAMGEEGKRVRVIHQTGEKDYDRVAAGYAKLGMQGARVEKFIYEMPQAYAQASLLVCRSGASTLSEIAAIGRASVLVPFPQAADNHQETNARVFSDRGAAVLMKQGETRGADLAALIQDLRSHPQKIHEMEKRAAELHRPGAAERIVEVLSQ